MFSPMILSTSSDFAESMMTGKSYPFSLTFIIIVIPSIRGIIISTIARWNSSFSIFSALPCRPPPATRDTLDFLNKSRFLPESPYHPLRSKCETFPCQCLNSFPSLSFSGALLFSITQFSLSYGFPYKIVSLSCPSHILIPAILHLPFLPISLSFPCLWFWIAVL